MSLLSDFWDEGRSPYEPDNPMMNSGMIFVAGFLPFILAAIVGIGVLVVDFFFWLF